MSTISLNAVRSGSLFGPSFLPAEKKTEILDREWLLDLKYPLIQILKESLRGPLSRPLHFLMHLKNVLNPDLFVKNFQKKSITQITRESIQSGTIFSKVGNNPTQQNVQNPSSARLLYVLDRVEGIAKKMGLKQEIHLYTGPERLPTGAFGSAFISKPANIFIDAEIFHLSLEEIDFVMGHEIAHIYHNDCLQDVAFEAATILTEVLFCFLISPLSLIIVEPLCNVARHYALFQGQEYNADQRAMQILGSNVGAVRFFEERIQSMKTLKNATYDEFLARLKPRHIRHWNAKKVSEAQDKITPLGNNRADLNHPPFTARLKSALEYRVRGECAAAMA
ncbi:MAG: M48 family metalloprotease [Chlamydiota bacterium]